MRRAIPLASVAATAVAVVVLAGTAPAAATPPPAARGAAAEPVPVASAVSAALAAARTRPSLVHYGPGQAVARRAEVRDARGATHVRLDRTYRGLRVIGGDVVVHVDAAGRVTSADGTLRAPLALASVRPALSPQRAAGIGTGAFTGRPSTSAPSLVVHARTATPRLAWETVVRGVRPDQTPSELHVFVDAATGRILDRWDAVMTEAGTGTGVHDGSVALSTTRSGSSYQLKDATRGNLFTTDRNNGTDFFVIRQGTLFTDADNVWGDGTVANRQSAAVDAQYGAAVTWDFFKTTFGRNGIANDGRGGYSRVHYGRNYNNAFWQDACFCMTYGDGDGTSYNPFTSLDVAGHEQTHGVTSETAGLVYSGESGGLNESMSDVFGTLVEFSARNASDPADYLIGEKIAKNGTPLRWMDRPSRDGKSADCWSSGVGNLNVHYSSGVGNHAFYLMAVGSAGSGGFGASPTCNNSTVAGMGNADAGAIWYRALTVYMTSNTNYKGARTAMLNAARDLFGTGSAQYATTAAAWSAVNVT